METVKMKRFVDCVLPTTACNMECEYCYLTCNKERKVIPVDLSECVEKIGSALSQERLGGTSMINICATGETLIPKEITTISEKILANGHYLNLVTNGTLTNRFREFCALPKEYQKRLFFKCSFHYLELKKQNNLELFFANIKMIQEAGISFTVEITPDDSYIPFIPEIKKICMEHLGTLPHVTVARDERYKGKPLLSKLPREEFIKIWSQFDSKLFSFKESVFEVERKEFCYAGEWGFVLNLQSGDYRQCYAGKKLGNLYKDVDGNTEINWCPVGHNCPEGHCFNAHAFLVYGMIPELEVPDYADLRNRVLPDGTSWLSQPMECFMRCHLKDANEEFTSEQKKKADMRSFNMKQKIKDILKIR